MFHGAKAEKEFVMLRLVTSDRECKHVDYHTEIHDGRFNEMKLFMFCKSLNKLQRMMAKNVHIWVLHELEVQTGQLTLNICGCNQVSINHSVSVLMTQACSQAT